ncbi:MAG: zinc ABC transporter substrate-binding protein [Gemmatimonadaceae bacterium]
MIPRIVVLALASLVGGGIGIPPARADAQLKVVTSTTDLYDIARAVGGSRIIATHIGEGYQDPHFIEAKPSFILQLRDADVWAFVGLDLEIGWMPLLLEGARNPRIRLGGSGYVDVSSVIPVIDRPQGNVDRSQGDVHPLGNPHYWLDPENGKRIARLFAQRFSQLDPRGEATYTQNERAFDGQLDAAARAWAPAVAGIRGKNVVAWHTSWNYFQEYTGMNIVAFMEPKPGVPPGTSHLAGVVATIRRTGTKVIMMEPFYDRKVAEFVASRTGATVLVLPPSVGGTPDIARVTVPGIPNPDPYVQLMYHDITQLASALR